MEEAAVSSEVDAFIKTEGNEAFAPLADKIKLWAKNPAYAKVPIAQIAYAAAGPALLKMGGAGATAAAAAAAAASTGGGTTREVKGGTPAIPPAGTPEFAEHKAEVLANIAAAR